MHLLLKLFKIILLLLVALFALGRLTHRSLPEHEKSLPSRHLSDTAHTTLGQVAAAALAGRAGQNGIHPLTDGHDAFAARALLAEAAERSIDAQYYIWHDDTAGRLLLQALRQAADRGVRVRLLLDDNNTAGMDPVLKGLDEHPNIELRLFNPFMQRGFRPLGYLSDFSRLNRRMHNKSFTVDNQITIVGGRNVGNEYFGASDGVMFADLDVAAIGPVVEQVSRDFDRYWASASSHAAREIIDAGTTAIDIGNRPGEDQATRDYLQVLSRSKLLNELKAGKLSFSWADARLLSDDPAKALGQASRQQVMIGQFDAQMKKARRNLTIVSPYFVPTETGARMLEDMARRGVSVAVLTNALSATDVAVVHAGYAKYRERLLRAGVRLFELKPDATVIVKDHGGITGSSGASLHAKTFEVDGEQLFVGSFNMDPRSVALNTEMGVLIDSPELAGQLRDALASHRAHAYELSLLDGKLRWTTEEDGKTVVYDEEPHTRSLQRLGVRLMSWLPIEWLL